MNVVDLYLKAKDSYRGERKNKFIAWIHYRQRMNKLMTKVTQSKIIRN